MRPFRELRVGELGHQLTLRIYEVTRSFPADERFGLTIQMRRAAASIPTNIAEGSARGDNEFRQFLRVALGSAAELEYQLYLSKDLGYIDEQTYASLDGELTAIKKMLVVFMKRVDGDRTRRSGQRPTANGQGQAAL